MPVNPVPGLTPLPTVPDRRTQTGNTLSNNMDSFSFAFGPWGDEIKLIGDNVYNNALEAEGFATTASAQAVAAANAQSAAEGFRNEAEGFKDSAEAAAIAAQAGAGLPTMTQNGDVLTITDAGTNAVAFQAPPKGGLAPLLTVNASAVSSVEFTGLDAYPYKSFVLICPDLDVASNAAIHARTSSNNGVSYDSTSGDYSYVGLQTQILSGGASSSSIGVYSADLMHLGFARPESHTFLNVSISALNEYLTLVSKTAANGSDRLTNFEYTSSRRATQSNNAIQIYLSGGTITGTLTLYGVSEA